MFIIQELKRRNVFRVAIIYLFASWLIVQMVATIFPAFGYGPAAVRIAVIVQGIGFIPAMILTWVFEITPDGINKEKDVDRNQLPISQISLEILEALSHRQYFRSRSTEIYRHQVFPKAASYEAPAGSTSLNPLPPAVAGTRAGCQYMDVFLTFRSAQANRVDLARRISHSPSL